MKKYTEAEIKIMNLQARLSRYKYQSPEKVPETRKELQEAIAEYRQSKNA